MDLPQTKQAAAIQAASDLTNIMGAMRALRESCKNFLDRYNSEQYANTWANMATAVQNADGGIGAPDASPVASDPITVGNINRSKNALVAAVTALQQFLNFVGNQAVVQGNYSQNIDDLAS
jgi:hypothetical protein